MSNDQQPTVALTVPNMNNGPVLDLFFEKLRANTTYPRIEVVVVDDGSTDDSVAVLRRWRDCGAFERFTLVEQENQGVIAAFNRALAAGSSEIVVRLDGDATIETPGWLERMLAFHRSDERIGITVAQIVFETGLIHSLGRNLVGAAGLHDRGTVPTEPPGRRTLDSNVRRFRLEQTPVALEIAEVDSALGCCTMFSRALADEIGGLDPRYAPVWIEDDDFGFAARTLDRKVFVFPEVEVVHWTETRNPRGGRSLKKASESQRRFAKLLPDSIRGRMRSALKIGHDAPWRVELLQRHYASWEVKWGFNPINPDLEQIARRYQGSEVLWATEPERKRAGEEIIAAYRDLSRAVSSGRKGPRMML